MRRSLMVAALIALACVCVRAQNDSISRYHPNQNVSGTIRVWGNEYMSAVAKYWKEGFQRFHPEAKVELNLEGTNVAMPGLYNGLADLVLLGRDSNYADKNGFLHLLQYNPLRLDVTTGSLNVPGKSYALVVYVHKDNPISKLTLAQLGAIYGCEQRSVLDNIQTWGQLGLTGEWRNRPINLYGYDIKTGTGLYFLNRVLGGSRKLNWEHMKEYKDIKNPDDSVYESGQQIIDALQKDPYGLAVSSVRYANSEVKPVALASQEGGPYYQATKETLIASTYPLTRVTYAFVNQPPGKPVDPKVKEFLRYVLSREGQEDIVRDRGYLPLSQGAIREQLKKLE